MKEKPRTSFGCSLGFLTISLWEARPRAFECSGLAGLREPVSHSGTHQETSPDGGTPWDLLPCRSALPAHPACCFQNTSLPHGPAAAATLPRYRALPLPQLVPLPEGGIQAAHGLPRSLQEPPSLACQSAPASASCSCPPCPQRAQTLGGTSQAEGGEQRANQGKGQPHGSQGAHGMGVWVCSPPGSWLVLPVGFDPGAAGLWHCPQPSLPQGHL